MPNIGDNRPEGRNPNNPSSDPTASFGSGAMMERNMLTPKQITATRFSYFFQRRNGDIFSTSAIDAWNIQQRDERDLTFIGASDGREYNKIMRENDTIVRSANARIKVTAQALNKLNNEEVDALLLDDDVERERIIASVKKKREKIKTDQDKLHKILNDIEQKAFQAELVIAKQNKVRIPNLGVVGDQGAVETFGGPSRGRVENWEL